LMDENNLNNVMAVIKSTMKDRQLMMFSATILQETIVRAKEMMKDPEIIKGEQKSSVPMAIEHIYFIAEQRDKVEVLRKLVRIINPKRAIAFVNQNEEITDITEKLKFHGLKAESIHGTNFKIDRKKTMEDFRTGKVQVLIASDIAARGLDIEGVTHIFNLNIPEEPEGYLHRVGRTGRNGNSGVAVSIITERELPLIKLYEKAFKINITKKEMYMGEIVNDRKSYGRRIPNKPV